MSPFVVGLILTLMWCSGMILRNTANIEGVLGTLSRNNGSVTFFHGEDECRC
jgi:hypothetical protein